MWRKELPDVRVLSCPSTESLKLTLGLTHPGVEEVEFTQSLGFGSRITVGWVETEQMIRLNSAVWESTNRLWCSTKQTTLCFLAAAISVL